MNIRLEADGLVRWDGDARELIKALKTGTVESILGQNPDQEIRLNVNNNLYAVKIDKKGINIKTQGSLEDMREFFDEAEAIIAEEDDFKEAKQFMEPLKACMPTSITGSMKVTYPNGGYIEYNGENFKGTITIPMETNLLKEILNT